MAALEIHLERLRRHYESAVQTYDHVSLLDLSHALRMMAGLRTQMPVIAPNSAKTIAFKNGTPPKPLLRKIGQHPFVYAAMPGGTATFASNGQLLGGQGHQLVDGDFNISGRFMLRPDGAWIVQEILIVAGAPDLASHNDHASVTRGNFNQWLDGEAVRGRRQNPDGSMTDFRITKEQVIRRVANAMDGSHPAGLEGSPAGTEGVDATVKHLMGLFVGGLPLPYFLLLKAADDILTVAKKWL